MLGAWLLVLFYKQTPKKELGNDRYIRWSPQYMGFSWGVNYDEKLLACHVRGGGVGKGVGQWFQMTHAKINKYTVLLVHDGRALTSIMSEYLWLL